MNSFGTQTVAAITTAYRIDSIILLPIVNLGSGISTIAALITRIAGSYLMKPMFGNMVIVYAEVVSWGLLLLLYVLRALWRKDGRREENGAASGVSGGAESKGRK